MEDNEDDADHWDVYAGTGPAYGRPFLEQLLLSLIDAHPNRQVQNLPDHILHDREARLRAAMEALFNEKPTQKLLDNAALFWMAEQHRDDLVRSSPDWTAGVVQFPQLKHSVLKRPRSARELAQEASEKFYPLITDKSERLRKKWQRQKQRWLDLWRYHDDIPETFETYALAKLWVALTKAKVPVVPNWPAGNAMSEHQMLRTGLGDLKTLVELRQKGVSPATRVRVDVGDLPPYGNSTLPTGLRSRIVDNINGLAIHMLEAGFETGGRPCILLLHGFPELAFSWRKVMLHLAAAGYHVVAPDQRGYGRTTGWDDAYDGDLDSFRLPNLVRDALGLVSAFGYRSVAAVVGHDFGSPVAAYCAVIRPDVFRSVALMSAPFAGPPQLPFDTAEKPTFSGTPNPSSVFEDLTRLDPPRKHYQRYYQTREANENMWKAPQGVHAFLRAYYHYKSADWTGNQPFKLSAFTARELAQMPTYYIMELAKGMAETAAEHMPSEAEVAACRWLTDAQLSVYADEFARTGFQGGLQWYRCLSGKYLSELETFSGRTIDVPACFIAGKSDWGVYQLPGALERMESTVCTQWRGTHLVEGAGHWAQQEQPEEVSRLLLQFVNA